ncbi:molybdopterin-dependent oxidoreductase [Deinococcus radiopugnans]|uniref:Anaerobic selenocysteine-containing dehydrogenase n=2 Tax=Deinococcus radiopugnans TaxID=57497 RepID=A0A5C4YBU2_9DEIO|nr:molybdopterin-dependent oxidoreductase [Deinococcus radiopugnans]MBB6015318.1 anaerobic selenocysteine-containing dehydrogenase [Deinococcus radiopugnans ATCC 19172]TNM72987.1 molybdopterin oxidoreductase family protein [Deinococcus radiopugnans ATCC 19172]
MTHPASAHVAAPLPVDGVYFRACNLCEAICGLQITVQGGRVTDLRGDPLDPLSKGHICPKGTALPDLHADPDRLKRPMRRDGDAWHEMDWDEALDYVAARLKEVREEYGADAVATFQGNPSVHNSGTLLSAGGLVRAIGSRNRFTATSIDQLPHHFAGAEMFGHPFLMPIPDIDRTDFMLMMGANPLASNGSIMTAPDVRGRLKAIRERGGRVVLLDPRRTESADHATEFHAIRPGTDAHLLLALLNVIFAEGLERLGHLTDFTDGLDAVRDAAAAFTPERVEGLTSVSAETIRTLARDFAVAERAVAYGRIGLSIQEFGGLAQWLVNVLNAVTGHLDSEGGAMFTKPAYDLLQRAKKGATYHGRFTSRVRGLPEFDGELPNVVMAEEMTTPGEGQIRALVTVAGNPVLSTADGAVLDAALGTLEFMVSIDPYLNETTRHAHVILPPAFGLEVAHYDVTFHLLAVQNTARYSLPVFPIAEDQRFDHQIFMGLAERLTGKAGSTPEEKLNLGLRHGPYNTSLEELKANPHGVDYGPLQPCFPGRLLTASGRVNLAPAPMLADLPRLEAALDVPPPPLVLIGRRQLRSNNSWMHNTPRLMRGPGRCTLQLNPADAAGFVDGQAVEVRSRVGAVTVPLELTDTLMPGVASLPHGFGHSRAGVRLGVASQHAGVSLNDLTDSQRIDALTGNAAVNGTPITLHAAAASAESAAD